MFYINVYAYWKNAATSLAFVVPPVIEENLGPINITFLINGREMINSLSVSHLLLTALFSHVFYEWY